MELTLNIYKPRERDESGNRVIEKTYVAKDYELMYGIIQDVLKLFDLNTLKDEDALLDAINSAREEVEYLLMDIFYELTEDELKRTYVSEIAKVIVGVLKYSIKGIASDVKNMMRG